MSLSDQFRVLVPIDFPCPGCNQSLCGHPEVKWCNRCGFVVMPQLYRQRYREVNKL